MSALCTLITIKRCKFPYNFPLCGSLRLVGVYNAEALLTILKSLRNHPMQYLIIASYS